MKKFLVIAAAGLLMMGAASQANAAFSDVDLIQVVFDTATATGASSPVEVATDLGQLNVSNGSVSLSGTFTTGWTPAMFGQTDTTNLKVFYFAEDATNTGEAWLSDVTGANGKNNSGHGPVTSQLQQVMQAFGVAAGTGSTGSISSGNTLVSKVATTGVLNGVFSAPNNGYASLLSLVGQPSTSFIDQQLLFFPNLVAAGTGTDVADIETFANGNVVINPAGGAATPIPPSVLLMGSGLLGLVGIRRRFSA